jgi:hypothetical protein
MRTTGLALLVLSVGVWPASGFAPPPHRPFEEDFDVLWEQIGDSYAYFDRKATDWAKVRELYRPRLKGVTTRDEFVAFLETVPEELYDPTPISTRTRRPLPG